MGSFYYVVDWVAYEVKRTLVESPNAFSSKQEAYQAMVNALECHKRQYEAALEKVNSDLAKVTNAMRGAE